MPLEISQEALGREVGKTAEKRHVHGFVMHVRKGGEGIIAAAGNLEPSARFFAASVTKLFVTTVILKLEASGKLSMAEKIGAYLPAGLVAGLHSRDGVDRSDTIELGHLLSNTSGIPDYFDRATQASLLSNRDEPWGLERVVAAAQEKRPRFLPGRKAEYSDTNFRLLGAVIEEVAEARLDAVFGTLILQPLGLEDTYLYRGEPDDRLVPIYYRDRELELEPPEGAPGPLGAFGCLRLLRSREHDLVHRHGQPVRGAPSRRPRHDPAAAPGHRLSAEGKGCRDLVESVSHAGTIGWKNP